MKFRPCIDIHNGKVKQIIGGSLIDRGNGLVENFVSTLDARYYATLYRENNLMGGHIILLNEQNSDYYKKDVKQAYLALEAYPLGLQIGGGITDANAENFLQAGASHVIVTSFVFQDGIINYDNLEKLKKKVGKDKIVLDLSCRKREDNYYIVTNRWQTFTQVTISEEILNELSNYCDEYLIHAVDVEGKASGIEKDLLYLLSKWDKIPITYAGGVGSMEDIKMLQTIAKGKIDVTVGSALDLFGGNIAFDQLLHL
ncbi:MAG: phosphoribosylformimino-5-aminoimidazole carboxamide ribotide isomerase [Velocimicrobium sp.]